MVTDSYRDFVLERLGAVVDDVRHRRMFGGVGIYAGASFFALIDDDVLYFKVGDANRGDFEGAGMRPFAPFGDAARPMQYWEVPGEVLEDDERLRQWAAAAITVAREAAAARSRKTKPKGKS